MDSLAEDLFKSILVIGKDLECAICLSLLKDATSLRCNHSFCSKCLNGLLQSNNRQEVSCPTCKSISTVKKSLEGIGKRDDKLNNLVSIYKRLQPKTHSRVHPNGEPVEFSQVANFLDLDSTSIMKENISENSSSSNIIDLDQNKKNSDFDASLEMERLNEKTSAGSNSVNATVSKQTKRKSKQSNNKIEGKSYNPDVDEPQSKTLLLESNLDELSIKNELAKDLLDLACSERLSMVDGCDDATSSSNGSGSITSSNVTKQSKLLNKDQSLSTKKKKSDNLLLNNFKTTTPSSSRNQVDENARNLLFNNDAVFATPVALNEGVKTTPRTILVSMPSADSRNEQQIKENENKTPDTILVNNNLKSVVSSGDGNNNINIRDFQSSNVIENKTPDTVLVNNHSKRVVVSSADSSYNTNNNINPKLNENKTPDTILVNNNSKTAASSVDSYNQKLNENKTPDTVMVTNNLKSIVSSAGSNDNNVNNKSNYIRKDSLHSISSSSSNENHSVSLKESSSKRGRPSKSRIMNILVNVDNNNDNDNHKNDNDNINARLDSSSDPRKHVTPQETSTKFKKKKIKISPISFDVTTPPQHVGSINNCVDNNKNDNENSASLGETIRPFNNIGEIESVPSKTTNKDDVAISILNESNHESINDALKTSNDVGINILNANNENEIDRIKENDGAIVASSTNNDVAIIPSQPIKKDPYRIGAVVTVKRRMGPGENKPGGVAVIKSR